MICVCANTVKKPLSQAGKEMNFVARNVKTSLMSTNQEERKRGTNKVLGKHENAGNICCHILQKTVSMVEYTWVLPKRVAVRLLPK